MVSIVISSYNHQHFIEECIRCVLNQSYSNFELVIVDDGSTDNTWMEICKFNDPRIKAKRLTNNVGACEATNIGLKMSNGKYICILSSDDNWKPHKLEKQVQFLESSPEYSAVFGWADFINDSSEKIPSEQYGGPSNIFLQKNRTRHEWIRHFFYNGNCLCHPTLMIRKECYKQIGYYDNRFRQIPDLKMWVNFLKQYQFHIIEEPLIDFRIHGNGGNTSSPTFTNTRRTWNEYFLLAKDIFKNLSIEDFYGSFRDDLILPNKKTIEHMKCEQAFLLLKPLPSLSIMYNVVGMELLFELLDDEKTKSILASDFGFETKHLHDLNSRVSTFYNPDQATAVANASIRTLSMELVRRLKNKSAAEYRSFFIRQLKGFLNEK